MNRVGISSWVTVVRMKTTPDEISAGITVLIIDGDDMLLLSCSLSKLAAGTFSTAATRRSESAPVSVPRSPSGHTHRRTARCRDDGRATRRCASCCRS